jgi:hypothetical protein
MPPASALILMGRVQKSVPSTYGQHALGMAPHSYPGVCIRLAAVRSTVCCDAHLVLSRFFNPRERVPATV